MADKTEISWCDRTWSPWEGCTKVSPACDNCYAAARNGRFAAGANWGPGAPRRLTADGGWAKVAKWNQAAARSGQRVTVFPSLCDPFDNEVSSAWRARFFELIAATPHLTWLLLTKRIGNASHMIRDALDDTMSSLTGWPWPNVWIGATVVNQEEADRDIPKLLAAPARVRFLSIEPMLGPVDLLRARSPLTQAAGSPAIAALRAAPHDMGIDWVICGGESGPKARPAHPDWFRSLRDQCAAACVAFHFKQHGEWAPSFIDPSGNSLKVKDSHRWPIEQDEPAGGIWSYRIGAARAGRLLDGVTHDGFPAP